MLNSLLNNYFQYGHLNLQTGGPFNRSPSRFWAAFFCVI
ncbi:hypothetical protein ACIAD1114 [Acinetobacter baylyi ADP1]|uniref:Uncharacterized protein n=1 Tax=Acinetobacter baylyi (strain ATCC 33305 / BD413 / ADP1) TaxID=62977 RepID=Q6FD63_ACIAD|nr:hypothetical protein ACIAD1114 [Acinetobacter baylyi ADP1]